MLQGLPYKGHVHCKSTFSPPSITSVGILAAGSRNDECIEKEHNTFYMVKERDSGGRGGKPLSLQYIGLPNRHSFMIDSTILLFFFYLSSLFIYILKQVLY